jgi:hypothetical protein
MNPACADSGYGYLSQDLTSFGVTVAGHQKRVTTTATWESPGCSRVPPDGQISYTLAPAVTTTTTVAATTTVHAATDTVAIAVTGSNLEPLVIGGGGLVAGGAVLLGVTSRQDVYLVVEQFV